MARTSQVSEFVRSETFLLASFSVDSADGAEPEKYEELQTSKGLPLVQKIKKKSH